MHRPNQMILRNILAVMGYLADTVVLADDKLDGQISGRTSQKQL